MKKCDGNCFDCLFDDCILTESEAGSAEGKPIWTRNRDKEKEKEYSANYYRKNKEKVSKSRKEYYQRNKDRLSERAREYYQKRKAEQRKLADRLSELKNII